ncbi:hypothetical protein [Paenibacillus silvae]|uniref:Uncharacterized protein n=1 Tax=Paenibacillus silvae TaxID=1325358 RepID=A0ABQ1ZHD6_9BACL|nr:MULTISPECIES: hypothetical protein [Paenibacillus]MCK6073844.1 hypothetical protein [Paenibacillus silvae]MCK6148680.1 hypothetical protein [Paenibacillus silvae]MCK6266980.1 hypothetical protein [Paenibacillus silvae]GGH60611.1 hypothetical protein GCM10008014_35330 [Paenibacillus silvae]
MNQMNKILGVVLMIASVFISTLERISVRLSAALVEAGSGSQQGLREVTRTVDVPTGLLVYFMFFVGFVLLVAGFPGSYKRKDRE